MVLPLRRHHPDPRRRLDDRRYPSTPRSSLKPDARAATVIRKQRIRRPNAELGHSQRVSPDQVVVTLY